MVNILQKSFSIIQIHPEDVLGPQRPGRTLLILGDTCDSSELLKVGTQADILVHEATLENEMLEMAIKKGHSTPGIL